ncbi:hypothetical protein KF146HA_02669 [Lactococcus lactis]|nr:hypothetical protein [Lactococcus lactis]
MMRVGIIVAIFLSIAMFSQIGYFGIKDNKKLLTTFCQ